MTVEIVDNLDPAAVKDDAGVVAWMGRARATINEVKGSEAALNRAVADLSDKIVAIQEAQQAPRVTREVSGTDADLVHRYAEHQGANKGKIRLVSRVETVQFAGRTFDIELPGILDDRQLASEWHREFQRAVGERAAVRSVLRPGTPTPTLDAEVVKLAMRAPGNIRDALSRAFSDSAASGAEWIPDVFSPELYMAFELPTIIEGLFDETAIMGPTIRPKITGQPRPYLVGEATIDDAAKVPTTNITTSNQTLAPPTLAMRFLISYQSNEDSALPLGSLVPQYMVKGHRDGYEDCLINGDTTATHQDTGITGWNIRARWGTTNLGGSTDHRRAFKGFRRLATDRSTTVNQASGMTLAKVGEELIGGMGEFGAGGLAVITSPEVLFKKFMVDTNVLTVDKAGPNATIIRGQLASVFGQPIFISRFVDLKYNASGIFDGSTMTKSLVIVVNRSEVRHYRRRGKTVEITRKADTQQIEYVTSERRGLDTLSGTSDPIVAVGYGWTGVS